MNYLTLSTEENDWIVLWDQYNGYFNNGKGPIENVQFRQKNLKDMRKTEETCSKYAVSVKFDGITREKSQKYPSSPTKINAVSI